MNKRIMKKSEILREGYVKGLKKAQRLIESIVNKYEDGYGPEGKLPDYEEIFGTDDEDWAIYLAECKHEHKIVSYEDISFAEDDGEPITIITGIKWGNPLH